MFVRKKSAGKKAVQKDSAKEEIGYEDLDMGNLLPKDKNGIAQPIVGKRKKTKKFQSIYAEFEIHNPKGKVSLCIFGDADFESDVPEDTEAYFLAEIKSLFGDINIKNFKITFA